MRHTSQRDCRFDSLSQACFGDATKVCGAFGLEDFASVREEVQGSLNDSFSNSCRRVRRFVNFIVALLAARRFVTGKFRGDPGGDEAEGQRSLFQTVVILSVFDPFGKMA